MTAIKASVTRTVSQLRRRVHGCPAAGNPQGFRQLSTSETILDKKLEGKVAIITGAAGQIGSVTAKLFAAHGAQVIVADIADKEGKSQVSDAGANMHYRHCDVTKEDEVASTVDFAVEKFGKLDIMFNNAGVLTSVDTIENFRLEDFDRHGAILVRGVLTGIKHAARVMIPVKQGVILNTGSTASVTTGGSIPLIYNFHKTSVAGLTKIAAYHLGKHGIRMNAVSPHAVFNTFVAEWLRRSGCEFTFEEAAQAFIDHSSLLGKRCTEMDIAKAALFLCSDDAGYISGQNLVVDGAWCISKEFNVVQDLLSRQTKKEASP